MIAVDEIHKIPNVFMDFFVALADQYSTLLGANENESAILGPCEASDTERRHAALVDNTSAYLCDEHGGVHRQGLSKQLRRHATGDEIQPRRIAYRALSIHHYS